MLMYKRGQLGGFMTLFWAMVVIFVILLIFVFSFSLLNAYSQVEYGTKSIEVLDIDVYMNTFYYAVGGVNKCRVESSTCQVLNFPCLCREGGDEVCREGQFCHGNYGCSDEGSTVQAAMYCEEYLGSSFVPAEKCEVDKSTCKVLNSPCSCNGRVCSEGQFCHGNYGCSDEGSTIQAMSSCQEFLGYSFVPAEKCKVDATMKVLNPPCSCRDDGDEVCYEEQLCIYGKTGCDNL